MANYVFNYLYMNEEILKKYFNEEGELDFNKIIPMPEISNVEKNRWCIENWGTKWNASDQYNCEDYIEFTTAWSMPDKIIEKIIEENPNEPLKILFNDEALGENCGIWEYFPLGEGKIQETGEVKISVSYDPHNLKINYDNQEESNEKNAIKVKLPHGDLIIYTDATDNPDNKIEKNKKWFIFAGGEEEEWDEIYGED